MEITSWGAYWVMRLDGIRGAMAAVVIALAILEVLMAVLIIFFPLDDKPEIERDAKRSMDRFWTLMVVLWVLRFLMPSTKDVAAIYAAPKAADNQGKGQNDER